MAASTVGLAVLDRDGLVRSANPALLRLTGLTRGQLVRNSLLDVVSDDEGGCLAQWLDDPHTACVVDLEITPPDSDAVRLAGWVNPLAPGEGDPDDHAVIQLVPREVGADLARAASRFDAIVDDLSDAVVITDADLRVIEANRAALSLFDALTVGEPFLRAIDTDHHATFAAAIRTGEREGISFVIDVDAVAVRITARELRDSVGQLVGLAFTLSPRAGIPQAPTVEDSPPVARVATTVEAVWTLDHDGPQAANDVARDLVSLGPDTDLGEVSLLDIFSAESAERLVTDGLNELDGGGSWAAELSLLDAAGEERTATTVLRHHAPDGDCEETWSIRATLVVPAVEPETTGAAATEVAATQDATAEPTTSTVLRDPATGLPTEAVLRDRLETSIERAIRNGRRACLVVLAVDGFDELTPAIGDEVADDLVQAIAQALGEQLRPGDTLARTGRAEFGALRDDVTDLRDAERFAERLRVSLDDPVVVEGVRWYVSLSAGVALTQPGVTTVAGLRRNGEAALDQAIRLGGAHTVMFGRALSDGTRSTATRTPVPRGVSRPRNPTRNSSTRGMAEEPPSGVTP
jgi:diguanylate cyclase (GGDEF)-like protein